VTPSTATKTVGATTEATLVDDAAYRGARGDTVTSRRVPPLTPDLEATTAAAVSGDAAALGQIYGALAPKVCGYLMVRGADDPEGLTNEVFLKVFPLVPNLIGGWDGLRTLVFSVAHARLVDDQRRRGTRGPNTTYLVEDDPRTRESAETEALSRLGHQELLGLLDLLPDDQRSVVLLRVLGDLSIRQTAAAMGRAESAVVRLQSKGLATLRQLLTARPDVQVTAQGASDQT
jgi:RNA polymerase sigma-70 factor, ECF subfamily